jgi:hypothetical protein
MGNNRPFLTFKRCQKLLGMVVHACNPSYSRGRDRKIVSLKPARAKDRETLSQKQNTKTKRAWGMAQVVEYSDSMHETLGSILSA